MKVLFVSNDPSIFEPESASRARMRGYASALGELHILSAAAQGAKESHEGNLHLYPIRSSRFLRIRTLAARTRSLIGEHDIAVVSAQDPFEHGLAALRGVRGTSAKLHVQVHTDFLSPWFTRAGNLRSPRVRMPFLNRWRISVANKVLPEAAGIRVVSERIKQSLSARYGAHIVEPTIIPVAVPNEVPPAAPLPTRSFTFTLIAVGRLEPEKRIEDILAALALVVPKYPFVGLVIVGEGKERSRLEHLTRKLNLREHVIFMDRWLPAAQAWGLMRSAQAFIQASAYEGYGRTLIEAALARVPIITTDVGIVGEVFKGYEDVLATPVADPTALSLSIVGCIEDTTIRLPMTLHAEAAARAHLALAGDTTAHIVADLERVANQI